MIADHMSAEEGKAIRKAAVRLVPFLALLYFISFLDRVNVGFAALTMNADIGLSASAFGLGAGIFFVGYLLFTIPGNLVLERIGASRWIAIIMVVWGILSACMAFVQTPMQFYVLRFLLGAAESGFLPGVILYLTYWFPNEVRGRIIGNFFAAVPLSNVFGAPLSTWLLGHSIFGLKGWQTMFVVEGLPAVVLGVVTYFWLADGPAKAKWLTEREKSALAAALARGRSSTAPVSLRDGVMNPLVWRFGLIYFLIVMGLYGFGFFAPQMLKALGNLTNTEVGWAVALPYAAAAAVMYIWGRHSDATGERIWHVALPAFLGAIGFLAAGYAGSLPLALFAFTLGAIGIYAACPVFWTLPSAALTGTAAAGGIALVNSIGNVAGYVGPFVMGSLKDSTGGYGAGLVVLAASMGLAGLVVLSLDRARQIDGVPPRRRVDRSASQE